MKLGVARYIGGLEEGEAEGVLVGGGQGGLVSVWMWRAFTRERYAATGSDVSSVDFLRVSPRGVVSTSEAHLSEHLGLG